jgi:hypothetical protein
MNLSLPNVLALISLVLVLINYFAPGPLLPVAVMLLALAIIFGGKA